VVVPADPIFFGDPPLAANKARDYVILPAQKGVNLTAREEHIVLFVQLPKVPT
jgi:hypothetical protein